MSIFSAIKDRIFGHPTAKAAPAAAAPTQAPAPTAPTAPAAPAAVSQVDVEAVLTQIAEAKGGKSNWRTSIVDLLHLLDIDPSLANRKDLANELNVHAGADGSAEENIALHKAVMAQLAKNGGMVPDSLRG